MGTTVPITAAAVDDIDIVTELWVTLARGQRAFGSSILAERNRPAIRESIARRVVDGELLVARDDDGIVGFSSFFIERDGLVRDHVRGTIDTLYVSPDRRGEGIGGALMAASEGELQGSGASVIGLEAMAANESARGFYRHLGYEPNRVELTKDVAEIE